MAYVTSVHIPLTRVQSHRPNLPSREAEKYSFLVCSGRGTVWEHMLLTATAQELRVQVCGFVRTLSDTSTLLSFLHLWTLLQFGHILR